MDNELVKKMMVYLNRYFAGLQPDKVHYHALEASPILDELKGRLLLSAEIVAGLQILLDKPDIEYSEWWLEMHEITYDDYWDIIREIEEKFST